jgi:hypothetical protein
MYPINNSMKQFFKKSIIFAFSLSLISSSCSTKKNNVEEIKELPKQEIINPSLIPKEKEVSDRGKVLCFERARQEKNEFLSEVAYDRCVLTIDENLKEYDEKQADLYFIEKKEEKKITKPTKVVKPKKKKITKSTGAIKPKKKKKKKNKNTKIVNTEIKENSCKEGSIAGGVIGAGIGAFTAKGKNKMWAVPAGGVAGALIGCQLDGG